MPTPLLKVFRYLSMKELDEIEPMRSDYILDRYLIKSTAGDWFLVDTQELANILWNSSPATARAGEDLTPLHTEA